MTDRIKRREDSESLRILMLEDSRFDAELILAHLADFDPNPIVVRAASRKEYLDALGQADFDVILADYSVPDFEGVSALTLASERAPDIPFIFVSGVLGEEIAIESVKRGATDYVLKQRLSRLPAAIERALAEARKRQELRKAEQRTELLVAELSHRVKNTLATVISIVRQTARKSVGVDEFQDALLGRLNALANAHALVLEANWREAHLDRVLERALQPFPQIRPRVMASGPTVEVQPRAVLALTLVFHELVTNAIKHGALSSEAGSVTVKWSAKKNPGNAGNVTLVWREQDGPQVIAPAGNGFGMLLLERSARYELDGEACLEFPETGFVCNLSFAAGAAG
ncbi:two-component sensor histidine kinase [Mesorhizobium sp. J18]|uniref:sensor histidine kinase n=1 Tax=Mesorhizobium sp. J18 TaxID=935263 RepID=UPI00119A7B6F|nr:HWE histidine kinase domain-containing protein [Mesorhizobium sp. J18]TWG97162.1 two-component sensor histidine kinase [Mesorhizobium sp. J18]